MATLLACVEAAGYLYFCVFFGIDSIGARGEIEERGEGLSSRDFAADYLSCRFRRDLVKLHAAKGTACRAPTEVSICIAARLY